MVRVEKEKTSQILLLGNENSHLQSKCEELESRVANIMQNLEGSTKNTFEENIIIGKIFMAIDNLDSRCKEINTKIKAKAEKKRMEDKKGTIQPVPKKDEKPSKEETHDISTLQDVNIAEKKLTNVMENMSDFRYIWLNKDNVDHKKKGFHK